MEEEKEKYYTPEIEDICIGYEYEITNGYEWVKKVFSKEDLKSFLYEKLENGIIQEQIRVPFLTKEQIEQEGWENITKSFQEPEIFVATHNSSQWRQLVYRFSDKKLEIIEVDNSCIFYGECKSINEFRKICKLLNIK